MFHQCILLLVSTASLYNADTTSPNTNTTTLYPVSNNTINRNEIQAKPNDTEAKPNHKELKTKPYPQSWKIESAFAESNLTEVESYGTDTGQRTEKKETLKDFKPSQHLGSFFDEDNAEVIRTPVFGPNQKKPAGGFVSSIKDEYYPSFNKIPKEIYDTHKEFPYKFEDAIYTRIKGNWQDLDSKPTVEVPVRVPAGGFYQSPEAFKDHSPSDEEYGLQYYEDGGKEIGVKKHVNPWQHLLRLVTAFIPVGLIISALTPNLITIHDVNDNQQPSLPYRRSDTGDIGMTDVAPISERCRRRLLCELHSDRNYTPSRSVPRRNKKHCHKIACEDTDALWRMLRFLLSYNQGAGDQRARNIT